MDESCHPNDSAAITPSEVGVSDGFSGDFVRVFDVLLDVYYAIIANFPEAVHTPSGLMEKCGVSSAECGMEDQTYSTIACVPRPRLSSLFHLRP